jgi:hypothetical protein
MDFEEFFFETSSERSRVFAANAPAGWQTPSYSY